MPLNYQEPWLLGKGFATFVPSEIPKDFWLEAIKLERRLSRETKFLGLLEEKMVTVVGCGDGQKKERERDKWFISYRSQPALIKTSLQMYSSERSLLAQEAVPMERKDILVIYLLFGSYPLNPAPPPHFITGPVYTPP